MSTTTERRGRGRDGGERPPPAAGIPRRGAAAAAPGQSGLFVALAFLVTVFNLLGLVMVMSASSVVALDAYGSSWYFVVRQAAWAAAGVVALVVVARIDYHRWRRLAGPFLVVALLLLALVLVPGVGVANGSTRWLGVGPLTIQPSEVVKLALLIWVADLLSRRRAHAQHPGHAAAVVVVVLAAAPRLLVLQPNLGTTIVIAGIAGALLRGRAGRPGGLVHLRAGGGDRLALAAPDRRAAC